MYKNYIFLFPSMTPMMKQYNAIKKKHKDCFLFFRLGDFYELFDTDAITASKILEITLTKRKTKSRDIPMCGVPHHMANTYLTKLINKGHKVAICNQISDPNSTGIVEREVVKIITPGTVLSENILDEGVNNYFITLSKNKKHLWGMTKLELSTGEVIVLEGNEKEIFEEIQITKPREILIEESIIKDYKKILSYFTESVFPHFSPHNPENIIQKQYNVKSLDGFGLEKFTVGIQSLAMALSYINETQKTNIAHLQSPKTLTKDNTLQLDSTTIEHLEIFHTTSGKTKLSLFSTIDFTVNPMGKRTLTHILIKPLINKKDIEERQSKVSFFIENNDILKNTRISLKNMRDIERLLGRLGAKQGNARDLLGFKYSLEEIKNIQKTLKNTKLETFIDITFAENILTTLTESIVDEPPITITEGGMIKKGYSKDLDNYIHVIEEGKQILLSIQNREQNQTGISSLKVKFSKMVGYCIEVTKTMSSKVPEHYIQKQTLTNAIRYITPELKEYEQTVLEAEEKRANLEYKIFQELRKQILNEIQSFQNICKKLSFLDIYTSFAFLAIKEDYTKPEITDTSLSLEIKKGKHPVLGFENPSFVANNIAFNEKRNILLLTGPNMGGKSTYLRMTALITLLAHTGSFVPAKNAKIPITDRIFTRVGASDDLSRGKSTFMVEMTEAANILHHATEKSLILLDEIGRGTSTYDGISIAWSITEHIHNKIKAKTLFATHYHELIDLAERLEKAKNISVDVKEHDGEVVFLYSIKEAPTPDSYGISVAKLAGIPDSIIKRAYKILENLEQKAKAKVKLSEKNINQIGIFDGAEEEKEIAVIKKAHPVLNELKKIDVEKLTPVEALVELERLQKLRIQSFPRSTHAESF